MGTSRPTVPDLKRLAREVMFPFYRVERDVPLRFAAGRLENDAEHSWSLALLACALAPQIDPTLDVGMVCQFAVVHDLVEIYAGDTSNFAPDSVKATKEAREHAALQRLAAEQKAFPWIAGTVSAYEEQTSDEARFVKAVDKVILLLCDYLEEGFFYQERKITLEQWQVTMQKHRSKAGRHPEVFKYYDELWRLLLNHPQFFYSSEE